MYRYRRLLVALEGSEHDRALISFAATIVQMAKSEKVYFVHVIESQDIPEAARADLHVVLQDARREAIAAIEEAVNSQFTFPRTPEVVCDVLDGSPLGELLRFALKKDIDLILVGMNRDVDEPGRIPVKLARKAPCSVLVVPEGSVPDFRTILNPIDFSENSADAMDVAMAFAVAAATPEVWCLHVYSVPIGYQRAGKTYEESGAIMRTHSMKAYDDFVKKRDLRDINVTPLFVLDEKPARAVQKVSEQLKATLLVLGARGRNFGAAVLLGSVTERLIGRTHVPLLAVKKKGTGMSLLEAFLKL